MARYQVILAYDGTGFSGFERQSHARTVQQVVEAALRKLGWSGKRILYAGRTDAGVHASGQVIAFDLEWRHSLQELQSALNAYLPDDVAARQVDQVVEDFHPRYDAVSRRYSYRILCQPVRSPLDERYAWRVWPAADVERLNQAAHFFPGTHDFAAFGTPPRPGGSTVRTVFQSAWKREGDWLSFDISADAFLYRMVRRMVYVQVEAGQGKLDAANMPLYLQGKNSLAVRGTAPPQGLSLVEVCYRKRQPGSGNELE